MFERPVNIWSQVMFDLHPKVKELLDKLNTDGQIDHDDFGHPYVTSIDKIKNAEGKNTAAVQINLIRNGRAENIIMHTRKRKEPVMSFSAKDYWKRMDRPRFPVIPKPADGPRPERLKRVGESFSNIVEQILGDAK